MPGKGAKARELETEFSSLSRTDQAQFHSWAHLICAKTESAFRMYRAGMMEEASFASYRRSSWGWS